MTFHTLYGFFLLVCLPTQLRVEPFFEEYFSYIENAEKYVIALRDEIEKYIDVRQHYKTPKFLSQYGSYFIVVSLNNKTSWYVFFDQRDQRYLVQYITNNHMEEASSLTVS